MKPRLVLACLTTTNVVARARTEFDAVICPGPDDMTVAEVTAAAIAHRAGAILFTNTLPLTASAIAGLPESVRVLATSSSQVSINWTTTVPNGLLPRHLWRFDVSSLDNRGPFR